MNTRFLTVAFLLSIFFSPSSWSAEIIVSPGSGTLAAAIASATNGDTLVLEDGGYYGSVTVNKSLTIRPVNRATHALVDERMYIDGSGIKVTIQGLKFSGDLSLTRAAAVRILENEWLSGSIYSSNYRSSDGDGALVIVGNRLATGDIGIIKTDGAYIAGNILLDGFIETESYSWIVGNEIHRSGGVGIDSAGNGTARILANRVRCNSYSLINCIQAKATSNLIVGNIVEVNDSDSNVFTQRGIYVTGTGHATVVNNIIRGIPMGATRTGAAIYVTSPSSRVAGNIVVDYMSSANTPIAVTSAIPETTHNLCFNNSGDCPAGDGNLNVDPMFADLLDYQLMTGSPAIDAGPPDLGMADLDRTRNDMGAHGGPWSIGQYDAQRDPDNFAPYVFPLFNTDTLFSGGVLEVKALGVARLR